MKKLFLLFAMAFTVFANAQVTPTLIYGTETNQHFKIYIVADGFTSSEMTTFNNHADDIVDLFSQTLAPFNESTHKYNYCIYRVNTVSAQSGYSVQGGTQKDTYWDLYTNNQGLSRYYGVPEASRTKLEDWYNYDSKGNNVFVIFLSNNPNYAGYGDLLELVDSNISIMVSSVDATYKDFLVSHEFGHSFGNLDDEYVDASYAATSEGADYIANGGNRLNIKNSNPGGWLEGGRYVATGKWRYGNGLMRSATYAFHEGNRQLIKTRINNEDITMKCASKPSGILVDDAFRRKDGTGLEYHYVIKSGNVYGYYTRIANSGCGSYSSFYPLQSFQYYSQRNAKVNDSNYYQFNDYQDWD